MPGFVAVAGQDVASVWPVFGEDARGEGWDGNVVSGSSLDERGRVAVGILVAKHKECVGKERGAMGVDGKVGVVDVVVLVVAEGREKVCWVWEASGDGEGSGGVEKRRGDDGDAVDESHDDLLGDEEVFHDEVSDVVLPVGGVCAVESAQVREEGRVERLLWDGGGCDDGCDVDDRDGGPVWADRDDRAGRDVSALAGSNACAVEGAAKL